MKKFIYLLISINKDDINSKVVEEAYLDMKKAFEVRDLWNEIDKNTKWRYIIDKIELIE